jgi:hypothetical protein
MTAAEYGSLLSQGRRLRIGETMEKTPRAFTDIDTWVFDLDNTLYPHHVNLWQQVDVRIGEFVAPGSRFRHRKHAGSRRITTAAMAPPCAA